MSGDIAHLAAQLTDYLGPFAPLLFKAGEGAAETAGSQLGSGISEGAKRIWARLRPAVEADPRASAAVLELSGEPDDEDLRAQVRVQLGRLLKADDKLAISLTDLLALAPQSGSSITADKVTGIHIDGGSNVRQPIGFVFGEVNQGQRRTPRH